LLFRELEKVIMVHDGLEIFAREFSFKWALQ